jgi:hypothetical protein
MSVKNAEKQKKWRIRNELVLMIYILGMTDVARGEIREVVKVFEEFSRDFDMEGENEKEK